MTQQMPARRKLIGALGAAALASAFTTLAQQPNTPAGAAGKVWRIGILVLTTRAASVDPDQYGGFVLGLRALGYVEGRNLAIDWRFADGDAKRLPGLAVELAATRPDVLLGFATNSALALQQATATIPIVMTTSTDPVASGLIKSLARPGGNVTGILTLAGELGPKRLEMLRDMLPKLSVVALLINPASATAIKAVETVTSAGRQLGIRIVPVAASTQQEIDAAFAQARKHKAGGMIATLNPLFIQQKHQIAALAAKYRMPLMASDSSFAQAACLMSYGSNLAHNYGRLALYVDKIFKGTKPVDLPVEQPTRFELVINGKTAQALGLKIPHSLLITAERVIE